MRTRLRLTFIFSIILVSVISWYISYTHSVHMAYNDAMSHINISRFVIDNREPGLSQLGSVWLPLSHIFPLLLIWNDWMWHSGFAGSVFSMVSFIVSVICVFLIIKELTKRDIPALVAACVMALNLNMLYLQTTPLTEPLYLMLFVVSSYVFLRWIRVGDSAYLFILGFMGFLQVLTRYDGWFVVFIQALAIVYYERILRHSWSEGLGKMMLFALPVCFGIFLWFMWNALIFGSPLYFMYGPYSAHAQQASLAGKQLLITKHNIVISSKAYWYALQHNVGLAVVCLSLVGIVGFVFQKNLSISRTARVIFFIVLVSPIVFNIIALYMGFSTLNVPELRWNPSGSAQGYWFNVRYGIFALPVAAICIGILANWRKYTLALLAVEVIVWQAIHMYPNNIITLIDGTKGSSAYTYDRVSDAIKHKIKPNESVLMSLSVYNPVAFKSNIQLRQVIHEGVSKEWASALKDPEQYADWIVMADDDRGDPVYTALIKNHTADILSAYDVIYTGNNTRVLHIKHSEVAHK